MTQACNPVSMLKFLQVAAIVGMVGYSLVCMLLLTGFLSLLDNGGNVSLCILTGVGFLGSGIVLMTIILGVMLKR
jgi:hypothetical protein